jgi:hypothetical protein
MLAAAVSESIFELLARSSRPKASSVEIIGH